MVMKCKYVELIEFSEAGPYSLNVLYHFQIMCVLPPAVSAIFTKSKLSSEHGTLWLVITTSISGLGSSLLGHRDVSPRNSAPHFPP